MTERSHDDEEFERIPWGHLSSSPPSGPVNWRFVLYGLAGAIAVGGITASIVSGTSPLPPPPSTTLAATTTVGSTAPTSPSTSGDLVSEADLMAIPEVSVAGEAAAWGEILTQSYWGVDGSGESGLADYLPPNSPLPAPAPGQRVFVDSARAVSVTEEAPATYRVVVRASLLSAVGAEAYKRVPARGLAWTLRWEREGWRLLDLPTQIEVPTLLPAEPLPVAEIPEPIRLAASQAGSVLTGGPVGELWRVVIAVEDASGGSWPMVRWFSPDGAPVPG
ncbi:MAG TPA: hypothetical protein VJ815_07200 [Acidimicrobiia bacterium]|nr:hypothetical protein [Acidimicrobiia bacterium]